MGSRKGPKRSPDDWFIQIYKTMLDEPAWKALRGSSVKLLLCLKSYYNGSNNGQVFLSVDKAAADTGLSRGAVVRGFADLQDKGFLRMVKEGTRVGDGQGEATVWMLTDAGAPALGIDRAPRDYKAWQKTGSYTRNEHDTMPETSTTDDNVMPETSTSRTQNEHDGVPKKQPAYAQNEHTSTFYSQRLPPSGGANGDVSQRLSTALASFKGLSLLQAKRVAHNAPTADAEAFLAEHEAGEMSMAKVAAFVGKHDRRGS